MLSGRSVDSICYVARFVDSFRPICDVAILMIVVPPDVMF